MHLMTLFEREKKGGIIKKCILKGLLGFSFLRCFSEHSIFMAVISVIFHALVQHSWLNNNSSKHQIQSIHNKCNSQHFSSNLVCHGMLIGNTRTTSFLFTSNMNNIHSIGDSMAITVAMSTRDGFIFILLIINAVHLSAMTTIILIIETAPIAVRDTRLLSISYTSMSRIILWFGICKSAI